MTLPKKILAQLARRSSQKIHITPNEGNRALVAKYQALAQAINDIPQRIAGLRMNFKRKDVPAQAVRLLEEQEDMIKKLLAMEKELGFKS